MFWNCLFSLKKKKKILCSLWSAYRSLRVTGIAMTSCFCFLEDKISSLFFWLQVSVLNTSTGTEASENLVREPRQRTTVWQMFTLRSLHSLLPPRSRPWAALRANRTKERPRSTTRTVLRCQTPTPLPPNLTQVTTDQSPPSCCRTIPAQRHLEQRTSTTASRPSVAPPPWWLHLEGCPAPSPVQCPTPSLVLFQVSWVDILNQVVVGSIPDVVVLCVALRLSDV